MGKLTGDEVPLFDGQVECEGALLRCPCCGQLVALLIFAEDSARAMCQKCHFEAPKSAHRSKHTGSKNAPKYNRLHTKKGPIHTCVLGHVMESALNRGGIGAVS